MVRDYDRDRFLLTLVVPPAQRAALWALFAFNHEIAKTREVVTETQLGLIRLQWWRDHIAAVYDDLPRPAHPVLDELAAVIRAHDLPQEDFEALLYAREFDLEGVVPDGMKGLENYADFTTTPLHRLACRILRQEPEEKILRDVATGYAMAGLVRAIPFHEAQGRRYMPEGIPLSGVTGQAEKLLAAGRECGGFTGVVSALGLYYTARLRKCGFNVRDGRLYSPPILFILKAFLGFL